MEDTQLSDADMMEDVKSTSKKRRAIEISGNHESSTEEEEEDEPEPEPERKKFRLNATQAFGTVPQCPLTPKEALNQLKSKPGLEIKEYVIATEKHQVRGVPLRSKFLSPTALLEWRRHCDPTEVELKAMEEEFYVHFPTSSIYQ